ncbi:hypothetical protein QQS21_003368 [Conoideocrella luteorostrata]|uniref:Uncharacterized protein n=1 Tax=Conoideocrella luteorostrata TaxID=1105319 RepID=A0AAJ0FVL8_9HYPO|nr:hypothetical protein QQS21_003368 [Conoideocrella luteorostrata]
MTNRGLEMRAKLWRHKSDLTLFLICLGCGVKNRGDVVIQIRHTYDTYVRTNIDEICYMDTINHHDWEEEGPSAPILVQANDFLDSPTGGSVFFIEKPCQVRIGAKYFMQFDSSTALGELQMLNADPRSNLFQGFKEHEISAEPNQTIFVNIDLLNDGLQSKLDVIINLTANGFPSVGIMGRGSGEWERLGDPLGQASQTYKMLADYLHFKMRSEPTYERLAMDETSSRIVGVTLCPKPSHGRMPNVPVEMAHLREYWIRIKIQENNCRRNEDFVGIM